MLYIIRIIKMLKMNVLIFYGFILINICFLIIGIFVLVNGSIMLKYNNNENGIKTNHIDFNLISLLLICIGVLFLIVSMFGILGTKYLNRLFLIIYLIIVLVMFLLHGYYNGSYFMVKLKKNEQCNLINLKLCCDFNESIISSCARDGHVMIPNLVILFIQFCSIIFVSFIFSYCRRLCIRSGQ